jgi:hypothetical protein
MRLRVPPRRHTASIVAVCAVVLLGWWKWHSSPLSADDIRACGPGGGQSLAPAASGEGHPAAPMAGRAGLDAAFDFLDAQMDLYHRSMAIYSGSAAPAYYPSGKIGDVDDLTITADFRGVSHFGRSSLKIEYRPALSSAQGWAGVYFLYPDHNWGQFAGRDLAGATRLTFWVCADHDTRAEFLVGGINDAMARYSDSLPKASTGVIAVTSAWQRHQIDLRGRDLSSVIGGFAVVTSRKQDASPRSLFLDDIEIDLPRLEEPRFVQSYLAQDCPEGGLPNVAQVYDQALVLLAFLARGRPDDLRRAELIARALVEAQHRDRTFKDGRLRNAYASGELIDPNSGATRIPGAYDQGAHRYFEDENAVGSDTGNMAWAALALVQAHALLPVRSGQPYLTAALSLARWIVENTTVDDTLGGFAAGLQGFEQAAGTPAGQQPKTYRSTEHNIDLDALFGHLAAAVGPETADGRYWSAQAAHARSFIAKMRHDTADAHYYWTGTGAEATINSTVLPLDAQTWAVLHTREPANYAAALDWALRNCTAKGSRDAFDFNCNDGDGAWWEGTAQVAAALRWLKRDRDAAPMLARLREAQLKEGTAASGAVPAASRCGLTTGFSQSFRSGKTMPWLYPNWPHVGATAWFIFASLGANPYFIRSSPSGPP